LSADFITSPLASPERTAPGTITLAALLNILWRRRLIVLLLTGLGVAAGIVYGMVVTPLYRATAQVRPGITAYTEAGGPVREWALKDITRFFQRQLYLPSVRRQMGWGPDQGFPVIHADFIARGAQNIQGGNVVTLETLSPSPDEARRILEAAISAFNEYAEADTVASGFFLTRRGLEIQIRQLQNETDKLDNEKAHVDIEIVKQKASLELVEAEQQRLELELQKVDQDNAYRSHVSEQSEREAAAALVGLGRVEDRLRDLPAAEPGAMARRDSLLASRGEDPLHFWLLATQRQNDAVAVSEMVLGALEVRERAFRDQARADSLRHVIEMSDYYVKDLRLSKTIELDKERVEIRAELADLQLQRDQEMVSQRVELEQQMLGKQAQLRALSSLERVGRTDASDHPVRPRRLRAVVILGFLGLLGSICLAFVWEYLAVNRDIILARSAGRS
jgi:hypothetical protein